MSARRDAGAGLSVAVVGATGAVGREFLAVLQQRSFPVRKLRLLASARSAGTTLPFRGESLPVELLTESSFRGVELALFSAGAQTSREFVPAATACGALVVDNSSAFRMDARTPLVVPEVNPGAAREHAGVIANPNCSTIILCVALAPLAKSFGLSRVVVSTYQSASGAGARAMDDLLAGTREVLAGRPPGRPEVLLHPLAFNLFPQVDVFTSQGYTKEEDKMLFETRKVLGLPGLPVEATCVRVPVLRCHSESVGVELRSPATVADAVRAFQEGKGLAVVDEPQDGRYPQPVHFSGRDEVGVGRIRPSRVFSPGLAFWLVGDQLRKGAALNAVQIAELLLLDGRPG